MKTIETRVSISEGGFNCFLSQLGLTKLGCKGIPRHQGNIEEKKVLLMEAICYTKEVDLLTTNNLLENSQGISRPLVSRLELIGK